MIDRIAPRERDFDVMQGDRFLSSRVLAECRRLTKLDDGIARFRRLPIHNQFARIVRLMG